MGWDLSGFVGIRPRSSSRSNIERAQECVNLGTARQDGVVAVAAPHRDGVARGADEGLGLRLLRLSGGPEGGRGRGGGRAVLERPERRESAERMRGPNGGGGCRNLHPEEGNIALRNYYA